MPPLSPQSKVAESPEGKNIKGTGTDYPVALGLGAKQARDQARQTNAHVAELASAASRYQVINVRSKVRAA